VETIELKLSAIRRTGLPAKLTRYIIMRKDGKSRTVEASIAPINGNNGDGQAIEGLCWISPSA
jgi:hypothetical protein